MQPKSWRLPSRGKLRSCVPQPSSLGCCAFADEAVHRPRVDELARLLRAVRHLRVALGDVDHLHAEPPREIAPVRARLRDCLLRRSVSRRDVEQRLLHEMRNEARIRAVREHGGRRARVAGAQGQRLFAQRVVRALGAAGTVGSV